MLLVGEKEKRLMPQMLRYQAFQRMVPVTGLEPVRCRQRRILSPLRLPIPSHRQVQELLYAIAVPFASKILRSNGESKVYVAFMIAGKSDRANCPGHFWQKW